MVVIVEKCARHHLKVALSWADKHLQLVWVVARGNREVGTEVALVLHVFEAEEEATNGSYL